MADQDGLRVAIGPSSFAAVNDEPLRMLERAGVEIVPNPYGRRLTEEETFEQVRDVDGLIAGLEPLNRRVLASAPRLRAVARVGIGMDNVDLDAAEELGVRVSNTPEGPTEAVAELTLGAMLILARKALSADRALRAGRWKKEVGMGLRGTHVLVIGYGRIGRRLASLVRALGAEVLVFDPYVEDGVIDPADRRVELAEGLEEAEIVSLHAGGSETILDGEALQRMGGAILLNSARGELVDEGALVAALRDGSVSSAWFDAFWDEPYRGPLTEMENVLLTPHIGTYTIQCRRSMETRAVKNLIRDLGMEAGSDD